MVTWITILSIAVCLPYTTLAIEADPLKDMNLGLLTKETFVEEKPKILSISGYLENRNQIRIKDVDELISLRQRLWLESNMGKSQGRLRGFISGYIDYDPAINSRNTDEDLCNVDLNEAYLILDTERIDIIFGQKMLRWGTTDGVNTMDLINPMDGRDPVSNARSGSRLPVPLLDIETRLGPVTTEAVLVPRPKFNKEAEQGSIWESPYLRDLREAASRDEIYLNKKQKPENHEYAFRLATYQQGYDLALLFYDGYIDDPVYLLSISGDDKPAVERRYYRFKAVGVNLAMGFEHSTIRAEIACKHDYPFTSTDGNLIRQDIYQGILGWDRTFFTNLYLNAQVYYNRITGDDEISIDRDSYGMTYSISDKFLDDNLEAGIRGMTSLKPKGSSIELFGIYKSGDQWEIAPGIMIFSGKKGSFAGQFADNDMVSCRIRYNF